MTHTFVVITEREDYMQWLQHALGKDAEVVVADQDAVDRVLQLIDATSANIVFVQVGGGEREPHTALIEGLLASKPYLVCVAIGDALDNELLLAAMRAGARDFLRVGSDPREVQALVYRTLEKTPRENAPRSQGQVLALLSARPYEGVTTLAVHAALALLERKQRDNRRVLLLDLGMPPADSLLFLGLKSSYSFVDAIRSVRRFDQTLIKTAFTQHKSGLTILSMPEDPADLRGVTSADVLILLNILKSYFSHIVMHLGGVTPWDFVRLTLGKADKVMLIAEQSVPSCHASKQLLDFLRGRDYPVSTIRLLIDRYSPEVGLDKRDITDLLGLQLEATLPPSGMVRLKALNSGRSIFEVAPRDPYSKAVRALASRLGEAAAARPEGLARWFSLPGKLFGTWAR